MALTPGSYSAYYPIISSLSDAGLAGRGRIRLQSSQMRRLSTPLAVFMALLVVLWQSLCLCHAGGGEGGHTHGGSNHAVVQHHHAGDVEAAHDHADGDHEEDPSGPCDDHSDGCDCSKLLTVAQKAADSGKAGGSTFELPVAWVLSSFVRISTPVRVGWLGVPREALPPPPILALNCQLLI